MLTSGSTRVTKTGVEDLDSLHKLLNAVDEPFWPNFETSLSDFKKQFQASLFWTEKFKRFLVWKDSKLVGLINSFQTAPYSDSIELGYIVFEPTMRRRGLMSQAIELVIQFYFEVEGLARIQVGVTPNNEVSVAFTKKIGFRSEGVLRSFFELRGTRKDVEIFSMLKDEWIHAKPQ